MDFYYNEQKPQRVLILAADTGEYDASASIGELKELIKTAGGDTVGVIIQQLPSVNAVSFLGSGKIAEAAEFVRGKARGLDDVVEQGGRNLSGGQRQRLTIARALVRQPHILILDDSASALDYATDAALRRALKALPGDMTVFIVSQRTSSLMHADKILVLDDGALVGSGTHDELMHTCAVYREIYESQYGKEGDR